MKIFQVDYLFKSANVDDKLGGEAERVIFCSALKARQCVAKSERDFEYWRL